MICQGTVHELFSLHKKFIVNLAQNFGDMTSTKVISSENELPLLTLNAKSND